MRTNIVIDTNLVRKAMRFAGVKTKREAVETALRHYVQSRDYAAILALYGKGGVIAGYDPKSTEPGLPAAPRA